MSASRWIICLTLLARTVFATNFGDIPANQVLGAPSIVNDTNVTLSLSGTTTDSLLHPFTITAGWNGVLPVSRGGTGTSTGTGLPYEPLLGNPASNGYVLSSTTTGTRSWVALPTPAPTPTPVPATTPGGGQYNVQYNAGASAFGGDGNLTWNGSTLGVNGSIVTSGNISAQSPAAHIGNGAVYSGGAAGQSIYKKSNTNYDYSWTQPFMSQTVSYTTTAGTTSTIGVMAGIAGTFTPAATGRALVTLSGYMTSSAVAFSFISGLHYGTGTPPANGAAMTGTAFSQAQIIANSQAAGQQLPFCITGIVTGLAIGTVYWIDAAYGSSANTSTARLNTCSMTVTEM